MVPGSGSATKLYRINAHDLVTYATVPAVLTAARFLDLCVVGVARPPATALRGDS